jgi:hypothetical protein
MVELELIAFKNRRLGWLFPLPAGEGQGEGESDTTTLAIVFPK